MPTPEQLAEQYRRGELGTRKARMYEAAVARDLLPAPRPSVGQLTKMVGNADVEKLSEIDADALSGLWLESIGRDKSGIGYFTADKKLTGIEKVKHIQNIFNPDRHADVFSDYDKYIRMSPEEQLEQAGRFGNILNEGGLATMYEDFADVLREFIGGSVSDEDFRMRRGKRFIDAERNRLLQKDFMRMRTMYEENVKSEAGKQFVQAAADGVWDQNFFEGLPEDEKPFIPMAVRLFKATSDRGVISQSLGAVVGGVWDITTDSVTFPADKAIDAVLSAGDILGAKSWRDALQTIRETRADVRRREAALATKFAERNFAEKGIVGLAHSLPLMASFFIPGPGGAAARLGKLGKFQKLVGNLPVAMATTSMAKQFEADMIDRGVDPEIAGAVALPTAIINMYVEKAALDKFLGIGKDKLAQQAESFIVSRMLKGGAKGAAQALVFESVEEIVQAYNEELVTQLALGDVDLDELNRTVANTVAEIAPTMVMFAGFGGAMGGLRSMSIEQYETNAVANGVYELKMKELAENATEEDKKKFRAQVFQEYVEAETDEEKETVLRQNFIGNIDEAKQIFDSAQADIEASEEIDVEEQLAEFQAIEQDEATRVERAEAAKEEAARLRDMGFNAKAASILSGEAALAEGVSGQFRESGAIEILEGAIDAKKVGGHEEFHGAVAFGVLTDAEIKILKDSLKQDELNAVARKYAEDVLAGRETNLEEEALADRYGEWRSLGAQEKTIMRKAMDFFARLANWVKGRGFKNAEDVFKSIEGRLRERLAEGATLEGDGASFAREGGSIAQRHIDKVVPIWQELLDDAPTDYNIKMVNEQLAEIKRFVEKNLDASVELNIVDGEIVVKLDNSGAPTYATDGYDEDVFGKETEDISHLPDAAQKILKTARLVSKRFGVDLVYLTGGDRSIHGVSSQDPNGSIGLNIDRFDGVDDIREASSILGKVAHELVHKFIRRDASLLGRMKSYAYKIGADLQMKKAVSAVAFSGKYSDSQIEEEGIIRFYQDGMSSMEFWDRLSKEDAGLANALANFISKVLLTVEEITRRIFRMPGQVEFEQPPIENSIDLMVSEFQKQLVPAEASSASFAREGASVASERDASTLLALAMLKKPNASRADLLAEVNAIDPNLDYDFVKAQADAILDDAQNRFNKKLDALTRVDVRRAGAALRREARATAIRKQGFLEGERLAQVRARQAEKVKKQKEKDKSKQGRIDKRFGSRPIQVESISNVDINSDTFTSDLMSDVKAEAEKAGIISTRAIENAYKNTAAHILWVEVEKLQFDRSRQALQTKIYRLREDKTQLKTANNIIADSISRLNKIDTAAKAKSLGKLKVLFKKFVGKAPKTKAKDVEKNLDPAADAELRLAKEVYTKDADKVDPLLEKVENTLAEGLADEAKVLSALGSIEGMMPSFKSLNNLRDLSNMQKLSIARDILQRWGALKSKSDQYVAEAVVSFEDMLEGGFTNAIDAAQRSADKIKVGTRAAMQSTRSVTGRKSRFKVPLVGMFFNINQRLENLTRFAGDQAAKAMDKVEKTLAIQQASDKFDSLRAEFSTQVQEILVDIYGGLRMRVDKVVEKVNEPKKEYAKYDLRDPRKKQAMSEGQLLQIIATYEQSQYKGNLRQMGYTDDIIADMKSEFTNKSNVATYMSERLEENLSKKSSRLSELESIIESDSSKKAKDLAKSKLDAIKSEAEVDARNYAINKSFFESQQGELISKLRELYQDWGKLLDEKAVFLFGTTLANNSANYMPVVTDVEKLWNAMEVHSSPLIPPSFNERVPSSRDMDIRASILSVLDSKMRQNAHWLSHAESAQMANGIFTNRKLAKQLTDVHGKDWTDTQEHLTDIYADRNVQGFRSPLLRWLAGNYTLRALTYNAKLPFTQFTSMPAYALRYGTWNYIKMLRHYGSKEWLGAVREIWNSEQRKSRTRFGMDEYVERVLRDRMGDTSLDLIPEGVARDIAKEVAREIKLVAQMGMWSTKGGDILPILLFGPNIYLEELHKANGDRDLAMSNTWRSIQETQQSYATKDKNYLSRRGNDLARLFNMFITTPGQYAAFEALALKKLAADPSLKNFGKVANAIFVSHVLLAGMYTLFSTMFNNQLDDDDWDDDDSLAMIAAMIVGNEHAWPVIGAASEAAIEAAVHGEVKYRGRGLLPLSGILQEAGLAGEIIGHGVRGEMDEAFEDFIDLAIELTAAGRQAKRASE